MADCPALQTSILEGRLRFEEMLAELSLKFVNLEPAEVDREIEDAQRVVCECLGLDLSALWQWSAEEPTDLVMTHLHRSLEGPPVPEKMVARETFPWCLEQLLAGKTISLSNIDGSPPGASTDRETFRYFGVVSALAFGLSAGGERIFGALSFHSTQGETDWPGETVQRLRLVAQVFANALVRKRADAVVRESEARLQLAAEAGDVGMWMLDVEAGRFWATDRARSIFGYSPGDDITMARFLESVHPQSRALVGEAVERALKDRREIDIEYRIVLPDGDEQWVHSRGRLEQESATNPTRLIGASVDITDRKRSFEEVQRLRRQLELENTYLKNEYQLQQGRGRIIGESPAIMQVLEMAERVAPTGSTVLIEGETGVGKEMIAQRIHELSPRGDRPMVKVNCAALPSNLVESELFGHEKGAYTGALTREAGRFEVADGSTLFLDEVAELPFELQSKLLRVLEEGRFERVGSSKTLRTDVRVIAATNRDLKAEVEAGRFRKDLYYRLAVFPIEVPPLRERRGDVPLLVWSIVQDLGAEMNKSIESIRQEDMERLQHYEWPGNVRELRNVVERALILCSGSVLRISPPAAPVHDDAAVFPMDEMQRRHILKVLEVTEGRIRGPGGAAEVLGMNPSTLRSRMKSLGLVPADVRNDSLHPDRNGA